MTIQKAIHMNVKWILNHKHNILVTQEWSKKKLKKEQSNLLILEAENVGRVKPVEPT